ncbi:4Fe-4S dicluster domain-containing protein [Malonomonas rubra DSM 5091]|uniref:4Fe-4S dicluster domain-containing protein n=1 Tax=Malonomonas rubra DSM 5091 TaxID=1122189 RepID=A0A1M6HEX6_MALRU|nr:4Fe-4S dicluster domain-containing protein [Malonomonas rubra]SHJ20714.1 4Fe-4S dicluster domain-containing protein [Malonomonas rubra DSM 5091]
MGHQVGTKSSIVPLIDRLNKYPVGLPDSETLRQILSHLFDEQEAYIASRFPLEESTLTEVAQATGISCAELAPLLDRMADKGVIMDLPYEGETYYLLMPGLIGFFEFSFMKLRDDIPQTEIAQLMYEYLYSNPQTGMAKEFFDSKTPLTRSLVYDDQIPVDSEVTSYENARKIIEQADFGAVGICYCRHKKHHLQQPCEKGAPMEDTCISLGSGARFLVRRGFAKEQSKEQLLAIVEQARRLGLTHITDNIRQQPAFICNCCSCCCELMAGVQAGYHNGIAKAPFIAEINPIKCNSCGRCISSCNVSALVAIDRQQPIQIKQQVCLGCGACLAACPQQALKLIPRDKKQKPPKNRTMLMGKRLLERQRAMPFIVSGFKKACHRIFSGQFRQKSKIP